MTPPLPHTLLIVEDSRPVRMLLRAILEGAGATVLEAEHGEQALRLLGLHVDGVDAVVTDLAMPTMDGIALIDALRNRYGVALPIVVCSAAVIQSHRLVADGSVDAAVTKPFLPDHLVRAVTNAIAARSLPQQEAV